MRFVFVSFLLVLRLIEFQPKELRSKKCAVVLDFHIGLWSYISWTMAPSTIKLQLCDIRGSTIHHDEDRLRRKSQPAVLNCVRSTIQMRGSMSNRKRGRQSSRKARIIKTTRTALKRKRWPIAVIKSTVASRTVMRTYWSPVSPDFVPCSATSAAFLFKPRNCSCLALRYSGMKIGPAGACALLKGSVLNQAVKAGR